MFEKYANDQVGKNKTKKTFGEVIDEDPEVALKQKKQENKVKKPFGDDEEMNALYEKAVKAWGSTSDLQKKNTLKTEKPTRSHQDMAVAVRNAYDIGRKKLIEAGGKLRDVDGEDEITVSLVIGFQMPQHLQMYDEIAQYAADNKKYLRVFIHKDAEPEDGMLNFLLQDNVLIDYIPEEK